MPRYFIRDEAEAMLPRVEPMLREIQAMRAEMLEREAQLAGVRAKMAGNGHSNPGAMQEMQAEVTGFGDEIAQRIGTINDLGILVKDLEIGLIDFPTLRDGREVYLCWKLGEVGIGWWHEVDSGYAGRQRLDS